MDQLLHFFVGNFPTPAQILAGGPPGLLLAAAYLAIAGYLKRRRHWKTGYTRKVFHFLTFATVAAVDRIWGVPGVFLFGGMTSLVILYALIRGEGHLMYEAMAREKDAPHRTYYIVVPYFATLAGGVLANIFFGGYALFGYLVAGIGDAIGEPVGTRWGRHRYPVPSLKSVKSTRSYEGSAAVFAVSLLMLLLGIGLMPGLELLPAHLYRVPAIAVAAALIEGVSPHGWDNTTMQVFPAGFAWWFLQP